MITDQGCQTNAQTAKLFMSSEPELWVNQIATDEYMQRGLCAEYQSFIKKIEHCQGMAGFSRFRVYGEINAEGEHCMVLVTEFKEFKDDDAFWSSVEDVREQTGAHLWIMADDAEEDRYVEYDAGGMIGESTGANHGRQFWQVELSWRIEKLSYRRIEELLANMAEATQLIWEGSGVGVC